MDILVIDTEFAKLSNEILSRACGIAAILKFINEKLASPPFARSLVLKLCCINIGMLVVPVTKMERKF